jgi:hypothetical protein
VWVSFVGNDPEAALFRADIDEALRQAGLVTKYFSGWARAVGLQLTNVPGPDHDHDLLLAAFTKAGLPIISVDPPRERFNGQLMIIVGSKPPPD